MRGLLGATLIAAYIQCQGNVIGLEGYPYEDFAVDVGTAAAVTVNDFSKKDIRGFSIYVEKSLERDSPDETKALLELVEGHLRLLENMVRAEDLTRLQTINIWATDNNCRHTAAFYYNKKIVGDWLIRNGRPTEMAGGTEFCSVDHLVKGNHLSAYLIHELAHGYHDHYLTDGFENQTIIDAYERQLPLMRYYNILKADGDYDDEGHANSNAIEYFAHLSNKYLGTDGEYPFVQAELREHDPWGWQVADAAWNGGLESAWLECSKLGSVKSGYKSNRVQLKFVNKTEEDRYLIWIDQAGEVRLDYHEWIVPPGESESIQSRRTHLWGVFDGNKKCVGLFKPGIESETVEIHR